MKSPATEGKCPRCKKDRGGKVFKLEKRVYCKRCCPCGACKIEREDVDRMRQAKREAWLEFLFKLQMFPCFNWCGTILRPGDPAFDLGDGSQWICMPCAETDPKLLKPLAGFV